MKVLSLEESKRVVIEFLKRINLYNEKNLKHAFKHNFFAYTPLIQYRKGFFNNLDIFQIIKKYDGRLEFSEESSIAFDQIMSKLVQIIRADMDILALSDFWELSNDKLDKHILTFNISEFLNRRRKSTPVDNNISSHERVFLFPSDFSFFISIGGQDSVDFIASTREFIDYFKKQ